MAEDYMGDDSLLREGAIINEVAQFRSQQYVSAKVLNCKSVGSSRG